MAIRPVYNRVQNKVKNKVYDRPVIVNGLMIFTDGVIIQFTDDTVLFFEEA